MNKILFLDFDGVLNPQDNMNALHLIEKEVPTFCPKDEYGHLFDLRCVTWLSWIYFKTSCDFVISSTWRLSGLEVMQRMWENRNLNGKIIDITPYRLPANYLEKLGLERQIRGAEIQYYLDYTAKPHTQYCIVDDNSDMLPTQKENFVQVNNKFGLDREAAIKIVNILNL